MTPPLPLESVSPMHPYKEIEAAQILNMGRTTLAQKRRSGEIRYCKYGNKDRGIRYTRNHIEEYLLKTQNA